MDTEPEIPWSRVTKFLRQHVHDVRNQLNSLDLEAALLSQLTPAGEAKECVNRLRKMVRDFAAELRGFSSRFSEPPKNSSLMPASLLLMIWQDQAAFHPDLKVEWTNSAGEAKVMLDPEALAKSLRELFANAARFGTTGAIHVALRGEDGHISFVQREPKAESLDPEVWGRTPLYSTKQGCYGLGLWSVDRWVHAAGGKVERCFDPNEKELRTTLSFPVHEE